MRGLVSVVVPVYNRETLVHDTLMSVYNQTYRPIQLIVVDDGSSDGTKGIVEQFANEYSNSENWEALFLKQENKGVSSARNLGMHHCTGEFLQLLDSDDLYHPMKTEICVKYFDEKIDLVVPLCRSFHGGEVDDILSINEPEQRH